MSELTYGVQPAGGASPAGKLVRLFLVGVCLPGGLALLDRLLLASLSSANQVAAAEAAIVAFGVFAGQLALLSWAVARFIEPWPLRWVLWIWSMALIDLQLAVIISTDAYRTLAIDCLATGVLAGQVGALLVWGILGSGSLVWRMPSLLVLLLVGRNFYGVLMRVARDGSWYQLSWNDLLWAQAVTLAALCGILRLSGVTLRNTSNATAHATETGEPERSLQFGIRDVLVGTTALAILLGLAKAGDLLTAQFLKTSYSAGLLFLALIATSTAAVLLLALWASLGQGSTVFRLLLLLLIPPTIGLPIGTYCIHIQPMLKVLGLLPPDRLNHWYGTGYWWIGWMFLAGTLLASLLLIFRVPGYRLVWQRWKHFAPRSN